MANPRCDEGAVDFEESVGVIRYRARTGSQKLLNRLEKFHGKFANNPEVVLNSKSDGFRTIKPPVDRRKYRQQYRSNNRAYLQAYDRKRRANAKAALEL